MRPPEGLRVDLVLDGYQRLGDGRVHEVDELEVRDLSAQLLSDARADCVICLRERGGEVAHQADAEFRGHRLCGGDLVRDELHRLAQLVVHRIHRVVERLGLVAGESELVDRRGARDLDARAPEVRGFVDSRAQVLWSEAAVAALALGRLRGRVGRR